MEENLPLWPNLLSKKIREANTGRIFEQSRNKNVFLSKIGTSRNPNFTGSKITNKAYKYIDFISEEIQAVDKVATIINFESKKIDIYDKNIFCKINNITSKYLRRVLNQERFSFFGWTVLTEEIEKMSKEQFADFWDYKHLPKNSVKYYEILDPTNKTIRVNNLKDFCRKNNLNYQIMHNITKNKYGCLTHQGYKNIDYNKIIQEKIKKYGI